ncbi:MAG: hypothetical protein A2Y80_01895 [Deltaproteobacteria bacterium RBG_13_58_19]|nr:MAG: hypothetical protein A2Y80_01895 [Deltaproteobacteria bacterium RBG_13_58_19]
MYNQSLNYFSGQTLRYLFWNFCMGSIYICGGRYYTYFGGFFEVIDTYVLQMTYINFPSSQNYPWGLRSWPI